MLFYALVSWIYGQFKFIDFKTDQNKKAGFEKNIDNFKLEPLEETGTFTIQGTFRRDQC